MNLICKCFGHKLKPMTVGCGTNNKIIMCERCGKIELTYVNVDNYRGVF